MLSIHLTAPCPPEGHEVLIYCELQFFHFPLSIYYSFRNPGKRKNLCACHMVSQAFYRLYNIYAGVLIL